MTLNFNGLNPQIKRQRLSEGIKIQYAIICCLYIDTSYIKTQVGGKTIDGEKHSIQTINIRNWLYNIR